MMIARVERMCSEVSLVLSVEVLVEVWFGLMKLK